MASAAKRLTDLVEAPDKYDYSAGDLRVSQIEAINERLSAGLGNIKLLRNRAESAGIDKVGDLTDLIPLLFEHTAYKSYPEKWLTDAKWDRMQRWLDSIGTHRIEGVDGDNIAGIDDWLSRLADAGHYVSCSSGTTGKVSMINSSSADRQFNRLANVKAFEWATGIPADRSRAFFICNPSSNNYRNNDVSLSLAEAHGKPDATYDFPGKPITIGDTLEMLALRRAIAEGSAPAADIARVEAITDAREKAMEDAVALLADAMARHRSEKIMAIGMYPTVFRVVQSLLERGLSSRDFASDNVLVTGGGLKRTSLPEDFREQILGTLNIGQVYNMYAMQELNTQLPCCSAGRFHIAPWLVLLLLDEPGEKLIGTGKGEAEGRAAFFDLSHDARWGGIITGDKVHVDYGQCACGHQGPTVGTQIVRYADMQSGDKITCAGTIDAYVRGAV